MAITVRANETQLKQIEELKTCLEVKTTSGALLKAAVEYPKLEQKYNKSLETERMLTREINDLKWAIKQYRNAQSELFSLAD